MKKLLAFLLIFGWAVQAFSQVKGVNNTLGKNYQIPSTILKDTVTIQVYLPRNYQKSKKSYATLYLLDGQWFFPHGVSAQIGYTQRWQTSDTPEFIVVGITTNDDKRWGWSESQATEFSDFLEKELITYVERTFRTTQERMLFGWEATGGFVIKTLTYKPALFDAYFAASPTPIYSLYFPMYKKHFKALTQRLSKANSLKNRFLYIGAAENDYPAHYGIANLVKLLNEKAPKDFRWVYRKMKETAHEMTAYQTIFQGIKSFYYNYLPLTFNSIAEFEKLGGVPYIKTYYDQRAKRFGFNDAKELEKAWQATMRNITLIAVGDNDYPAFDRLYKEFKSRKLLETSFMPHAISYARFYLMHNQPQKAMEINQFLLKKFAKRAAPYNMAGKIYEKLHKPTKAQQYYEQAVKMAKKSDRFRLSQYEENLSDFLAKQKKK
ncbi:hypothetical protein BKI52_04940 [marine bacterium AO1-C]|nr:hypothetical protein BKI52_04940 [marine bacterium AO1-C]